MYHAMEENRLYNFNAGKQIEIDLKSGKNDVDLVGFLDGISDWMELHQDVIREKYLPLSCLSVGLIPSQASAFLYGCFVGRAMEKNKITVSTKEQDIDKDEMARQMKKNIKHQMGWLKKLLSQIEDTENKKDKDD
jgi:hypothetical protein